MNIENIIGNYKVFWNELVSLMKVKDISLNDQRVSHLGVRVESFELYRKKLEELKCLSHSFAENIHNGRSIAKLKLKVSLELEKGFYVDLIELMPPKPNSDYLPGLEHVGIVLGDKLKDFFHAHKDVITGRQNQSSICKPYYIQFKNQKRVKFYNLSLEEVVRQEGHEFHILERKD